VATGHLSFNDKSLASGVFCFKGVVFQRLVLFHFCVPDTSWSNHFCLKDKHEEFYLNKPFNQLL
jgi:hypothetical protein